MTRTNKEHTQKESTRPTTSKKTNRPNKEPSKGYRERPSDGETYRSGERQLDQNKSKRRQQRPRRDRRRTGRVAKRRRSVARRRVRRMPQRRARVPSRAQRRRRSSSPSPSAITTYSAYSGASSEYLMSVCSSCRHNRCSRRNVPRQRRSSNKRRKKRREPLRRVEKRRMRASGARRRNPGAFDAPGRKLHATPSEKCVQVGAPHMGLSHLCIRDSCERVPSEETHPLLYSQITPHMIYDCLRKMSKWTKFVTNDDIADYLKNNYPVNEDPEGLQQELCEKLRVATKIGMVVQTAEGWQLSTKLIREGLNKTHVTLLWETYIEPSGACNRNRDTDDVHLEYREPNYNEDNTSDEVNECARKAGII